MNTSLTLNINSLKTTKKLAQRLAKTLINQKDLNFILFKGALGSGKTTIISELVKNLPNGHMAETSSPSFTLYNLYPTAPPVAHFDLYREKNNTYNESLLDFLENERHLVLIEWAERIPKDILPKDYLELVFSFENKIRHVNLFPHGPKARDFLKGFNLQWLV